MGFSRQESWSGLPFPSPGDLPDPGIEPRSPALRADALPSGPPGKPCGKLQPKNNFHQRSKKTQKQREIVKGDLIIIINVVIKHSWGPLVPSLGLEITFWVISWELSYRYWTPTPTPQVEKSTIITQWPDCSHDISCHSSENWPQANGTKPSMELKI